MTGLRGLLVASAIVVSVGRIAAEEPLRYRGHALGSNLASILAVSGARPADVKLLHTRPAKMQELEWRVPYAIQTANAADPVRSVLFNLYDDQLYRVTVTYDRERTEGLTNKDLTEALSAVYGVPVAQKAGAKAAPEAPLESIIVAQWDAGSSEVTLYRVGVYSPQVLLVLSSKPLENLARVATKEALRLDAKEAPQRALDQRKKDEADAQTANDQNRLANKTGFKP